METSNEDSSSEDNDSFSSDADSISVASLSAEADVSSEDEGVGKEVDGEGGAEEDYEDEDIDPKVIPEDQQLQMPSILGSKACISRGKKLLMEQEIELREAQANDALEQIRMTLGQKSLLFRRDLRPVKSQKQTTRAWSCIRNADAKVQKYVKTYNAAFHALKRLDAVGASSGTFQPITKDDLKMNSDLVEENRFGQSSDTVSWFWRTAHQGEEEQGDDWMKESEC